jgi:hypothetical protein
MKHAVNGQKKQYKTYKTFPCTLLEKESEFFKRIFTQSRQLCIPRIEATASAVIKQCCKIVSAEFSFKFPGNNVKGTVPRKSV